MEELRRSPRHPVAWTAECALDGDPPGVWQEWELVDISPFGAGTIAPVRTEHLIGRTLTLCLDDRSRGSTRLQLACVVKHQQTIRGGKMRLGLEFWPGPGQQTALEELLDRPADASGSTGATRTPSAEPSLAAGTPAATGSMGHRHSALAWRHRRDHVKERRATAPVVRTGPIPAEQSVAVSEPSIMTLVSAAVLGAGGDVAAARERRRARRLRHLAELLLIPLAWIIWRDLTNKPLFWVPHLPPQYLLPILLIGVLCVVMLGPILGAGVSPHVLYRPEDIKVGLDEVVGIDALKSEVVRTLNLFLGHKRFRDVLGGTPRRGVLFEGPPGTGKTYVAQALAKEAGVPFLFVSASAFQSMFYGQTNRKIRSYFRALRKHADAEGGAIGFIEEIDAIGGARHGMGGMRGEGVSGVVNELLVQLQSFDEPSRRDRLVRSLLVEPINGLLPPGLRIPSRPRVRPNVLVIAATNRASDLDPALVRPGRFDRSLRFSLPGREGRRDIVAHYLCTKAHDPNLDVADAAQEIAAMTPGYSPAALRALLDEALVVALSHGRSGLRISDVTEAKLAVETGVKDPAEYSPEECRRIALHEAGHATVAYYLGEGRRLDVLSIVKRSESLGLLQHSDAEERFTRKRNEAQTLLTIAMGGRAAEALWFDDEVSSGPAGDLAAATSLAAQMVGAFGMGDTLVSMAAEPLGGGPFGSGLVGRVLGDKAMRAEVEALLERAYLAAVKTLSSNRAVVDALADALVARRELIGSEILAVIESVPGVRPGRATANRHYDSLLAATGAGVPPPAGPDPRVDQAP